MTVWLSLISGLDIKKQRVPVWLLIPGGLLTLAETVKLQYGGLDVVIAMIPGCVLLVLAMTTRNVGYGDGIVMLLLGMTEGSEKSLLMFGTSLFLSAICSLILLAMKKARKSTRIPFLPFLSAAWFITVII